MDDKYHNYTFGQVVVHEFFGHGYHSMLSPELFFNCSSGNYGWDVKEVYAMTQENKYLFNHGLPQRAFYGKNQNYNGKYYDFQH